MRVRLPTLPTLRADGPVSYVDATLAQERLHVAVAQRQAIESDSTADHLAGAAGGVIAAASPEVGLVFTVVIMSWAGKDRQPLDNAIVGNMEHL